jgi:hypothetical protein
VAQQVSRTDKFRLTYIRSLFADMGFRGNQLDMRSENALGAITMQDHLRVRHKPRKAADTAFLMTQIYFDVANQREHKQGRRLK